MTMEKLTASDPATESADVVAENIERLKALFPELVTEGKDGASINVDVLKQLVGDQTLTDADEKYGLNWFGKRRARQLALTPSTGTLRPCPEDSVDWDTTQNLMIEGDNLEVLKLLQKSYAGKVKLIYIDPPYNTGKDFVYPDNYQDSIKNYMELTGQVEGGAKISSNTEASGRFHTDWVNMLYARLKLARSLLREDGCILISIDEKELQHLRLLCNDVFGEENFVAVITVLCNPKGRSQDKYFATNHEYVLAYSKRVLSKGSFSIAKEDDQIDAEYNEEDDGGKYRLLELRNTHREFGRHNRRNLYYPLFTNDEGEVSLEDSEGLTKVLPIWDDGFDGCWTWDADKAKRDIELLAARMVKGRWKVFRKSYASGADRMLKTILINKLYYTERGQKEFNQLFDTREKLFQAPKSPFLLAQLFATCTGRKDVVLDFFAGSGTTGHAVMAQNAADGGNREYILVQLPEPLDPDNKDQKVAANFCDQLGKPRTIAELTKERLRRAGAKVKADNPDWHGDTGFRVFKLDSSNIRAWDQQPADLDNALLDSVNHLTPGRSEADVLYELLLKLGLDLCVPIEEQTIAGKTVHSVGGGTLIACLAEKIGRDKVEALAQGIVAWHTEQNPAGEITCVFRDSAFADDVAKTNLAAILEQHGIANVRSL
jgi:adenine-specific DNA-methyltransferase